MIDAINKNIRENNIYGGNEMKYTQTESFECI